MRDLSGFWTCVGRGVGAACWFVLKHVSCRKWHQSRKRAPTKSPTLQEPRWPVRTGSPVSRKLVLKRFVGSIRVYAAPFSSRNHEPHFCAVCAGAVAGLCVPGGGERSRGGGGPDPVSVCGRTAAAPQALQPADVGGDSDPGSSVTVFVTPTLRFCSLKIDFTSNFFDPKFSWSEFRFFFSC